MENLNNSSKKEEEKINNYPQKKLGAKNLGKILDNYCAKFLDLSLGVIPPEEEDLKKKRAIYSKINSNFQILKTNNLPEGKDKNLVHIYDDSIIKSLENLIEICDKSLSKIDNQKQNFLKISNNKIIIYFE